MNIDSRSRGVRVVADGDTTRALDVRCGSCTACTAALDFWCLDAQASGHELFSLPRAVSPDELRRWLAALAALATATAEPESVLLVLHDADPAAVTDLVRAWHPGPVLASADARGEETRARLTELSATGRAPVVLTLHHARTAVRSVERGGQVCLPDADVDAPSVTELVQRDVRLLAARQVSDLVPSGDWADLGRRLDAVLVTDRSPVQAHR